MSVLAIYDDGTRCSVSLKKEAFEYGGPYILYLIE
jgi:hypothetical protein